MTFELLGYDLAGSILVTGVWLAAGMLIGAAYFLTLQRNVRMFVVGRSFLLPLGFQLSRFVLLAIALAAIAIASGALPMLTITAGILVARTTLIRWGAEL
jgi:hypothetical protein